MNFRRTAAVAASSLAALLSLAACGERTDGQAVGQRPDSAARTSQAARDAKQDARDTTTSAAASSRQAGGNAASTANDATRSAASNTKDTAQAAREDARSSVMGAGADTRQAMGNSAQVAGAKVDDAQITSRVAASLMGDKELSAVHIDVDTRDGVVTLSGPVPSSSVKARANEIAKGVKDVKSVDNQLTVSAS